ncbi:MAG: glycosyltransferase [Cyanobacteria bacterium P01_D01_bin.123]
MTVGTEQFPFNRLMQWIDVLQDMNAFREEVVVQYGSCTELPKASTCHRLLPEAKFKALVHKARIVVAHCGEGSLLTLSEAGVPFILVPRSHIFGEHVDDHQVELARAMMKLSIPVAWSPRELWQYLVRKDVQPLSLSSDILNTARLCQLLAEELSLQASVA